MKTKHIAPLAALAALSLIFAGCSALDVVGKTAITTFQVLMDKERGSVALDPATNRWVLTSPGGEKFEWSASLAGAGPDFRVSLAAAPYLAAGLDPAALPAERYEYDASAGTLALVFEIGKEQFKYPGSPGPLETFTQIVAKHRPIIGYHAALDHYGIALGDGNMFEWAKDLATNDKDIVFVLNPEPLLKAGVDPAKITGWVFTKIPVKDKSGKTVEVDKFVKPYDLP